MSRRAIAFALLGALLVGCESPEIRYTGQRSACIYNLRNIQEAKVEWAKVLHKLPTDTPTLNDVCGTNGTNEFLRYRPTCPAGGIYTIGSVGENPTCSLAAKGHALPPDNP